MPRWLLNFDAIDPADTESRWKVGIHRGHYDRIVRHGHEKQQARILLVRDVLEDEAIATRLYGGWSRPDKDDCFVYVGEPTRDFKSTSIETPPPPGMVFLVFVLPDGTIDDWTWRPSSSGDGTPDGVQGELIWEKMQN